MEALALKLASEILADGEAQVYRVAGESGCGKTTLAKALKTEAERQGKVAVVVSQDEFFKLPPRQNHNKRVEDFSWIGPGEVDFELLRSKIAEVLDPTNSEVRLPKMNWEKDTLESETVECERVDCVVVEGTYVLEDLAEGERAVFFAHTYMDTREARIARNREVVDDFIARVLAKEHKLIAPYGEKAHYIITTDYQLEKRTT
jgi:uridine kinase